VVLFGGLLCLRAPSPPASRRVLAWGALAELIVAVLSATLVMSRSIRYPDSMDEWLSLAVGSAEVLHKYSASLILPALVLYVLTRRSLVASSGSA
jgi:hypothetical protein